MSYSEFYFRSEKEARRARREFWQAGCSADSCYQVAGTWGWWAVRVCGIFSNEFAKMFFSYYEYRIDHVL